MNRLVRVGQVPNALAAAHFLATTPLLAKKAVFVITETRSESLLLAKALPLFGANTRIKDEASVHEHTLAVWNEHAFQLAALRRGVWITADADQVAESRTPSPTTFEKQQLQLHVGIELPPQSLKEWLTRNGYEPETTANAPGRWAGRGEIVDIHTTQPLRIQYDGDTIESIRSFDLLSGTSSEQFDSVLLPPLNASGRSSLLDHLPEDGVIVHLYRDPLNTEDSRHAQIVIEPVALPASAADSFNAKYTETKAYHLRTEELRADAQAASQVIALTTHTEKLAGLLGDSIALTAHELSTSARGFEHKETGLLVLTDTAVGFAEEDRKRQSNKVQQAMIQSLRPGDYVVHMYHGVARFNRMETMHINEMDREYFVLEFAGTDKIYLPVELAERIDKYVGDEKPQLSKLSTAQWHEVVRRVKEQTLELARELLDLYARRQIATAAQMVNQEEESELQARCAYELTPDQYDALSNIYADMAKDEPMDRLLCGDVGFGKTEVAIRAAYRAVLNGYQVAVLVPTTVLAQQHYDTFHERLSELGVQVASLSRLRTSREQKATLERVAAGQVDVVVGTHRLLSRDVHFKRLGFIVIDEEQRFGVAAKEKLKRLRTNAHVLSMTATPIPRTLHMSIAGLRDISTILTPPQQRKSVKTVITPMDREIIVEAVQREMERGGQSYYIYNRVRGIEFKRRELQELLPKARIGVAHGQMAPEELADVMHAFDTGELDILLATTIVENGIDIPTANTLVVEKASMFGLAELYQLKGRVGRSDRQGFAYFFYEEDSLQGDVRQRFIALQEAERLGSGFELAMKDMEIRGVGNMLGKEQHGHAVKIGLNLYLRLLNQALRELEGEEIETERDIPIDLPLEARIPESLLPDQEERILLYQQLANIRDIQTLHEKRLQYSKDDRFGSGGVVGELHPNLAALFDLLEIKLLASKSSLLSIDTTYPNDVNRLDSVRITVNSDAVIQNLAVEWERVATRDMVDKVRSTLAELGDNWVEKLKHLIRNAKEPNQSE